MRLARKTELTGVCYRLLPVALLAIAGIGLGGCNHDYGIPNSFINPGEPNIISDQGSLVKPILDTLDPSVEETASAFGSAEEVRADDLTTQTGDYRIGKNDLVSVTISDLLGEGTGDTVKTVRVSESGMISLPFLDPVHADGLTEQELESAIKKAYHDAQQITKAQVSVTVVEARNRTFSIQGNVGAPGQYQILTSDFRMLDALVLGHGPSQPDVDFAYVIRKPEQAHNQTAPAAPATAPETTHPPATTPTNDLLEPPHTEADPAKSPASVQLLQTRGSFATTRPARSNTSDLLAPGDIEPSTGLVEGRPMPIRGHDSATTRQADEATGGLAGFKFNAPPNPYDQRIIKVPIQQLLHGGDLQYNIVIRPGDMIIIPDPITGEYYMSGHVNRGGVYSLTGRKITLKMALASAGGFDQEAIPGRTEIIRRIGANKEVFVRVDYDKVWSGEQPDIYLKPNDVVQVGTNVFAPFIAALRNSFRLTYGFGFLYDRNFSPINQSSS